MSQYYDALIEKLFPGDPASQSIAMSFVERFDGGPFADRIINSMLQEGARVNAQIISGELTAEEGREFLISAATENYGLPPHVVQDGKAWLDDVVAIAEGDQAEAGPRNADAPPGAHDRLIARLFSPAERPAAAAIAKAMEARPELQSRVEALLTELARPTDLPPAESYAFIRDFAEKIGIPAGLVTGILDASSAPAERAREAEVTRELVGEVSPWAQNAQRTAEREAATKEVKRWESAMRAEPGTAEWKSYWREGGAEAYRAALERSQVEPPTMPAAEVPPAAPSPAEPSPAPAAEPAAPT